MRTAWANQALTPGNVVLADQGTSFYGMADHRLPQDALRPRELRQLDVHAAVAQRDGREIHRAQPTLAPRQELRRDARPVVVRHEVTAHDPDGGLTIRYLAGSKQGLLVHFFTGTELDALFAAGFTPVLPLRLQSTRRDPPAPGQWSQWEAIWSKAQSTAWRRRRQVDPVASAATPASGRYHSHEAPGPAPYPT